jgi:hypothetical protein
MKSVLKIDVPDSNELNAETIAFFRYFFHDPRQALSRTYSNRVFLLEQRAQISSC